MGTYPVVVVDLSHHNTIESWEAIKASGVVGVILKATEGTTYVDKVYATRVQQARDAGLLVGAYHFANNSDPIAQAKHFLKHSLWDENTLLAHDWEDPPHGVKPMTVEQTRKFCEYIYQVTGQRPVIYSGNTAKRLMGDQVDEYIGQHRLWLASYTNEVQFQPSWNKYWIWQFQGDNMGPNHPRKVRGVNGTGIDTNTGDPPEVVAQWTGGRPNKPNTGEFPADEVADNPKIGIDDVAVVGAGGAVLTQTDWITGLVVVGILVGIFVWWKYFRNKSKAS